MMQLVIFLSSLKSTQRAFGVGVSFVGGSIIYAALPVFEQLTTITILAITPFMISACYYFANERATESNARTYAKQVFSHQPLTKTLISPVHLLFHRLFCGLLFGFALCASMIFSFKTIEAFPSFLYLVFAISGLVVLRQSIVKRSLVNIEMNQWVLLTTLTISLFLMPIIHESWGILCLLVVCACFGIYWALEIIILSELMDEEREGALAIMLSSLFLDTVGLLFGWGLAVFSLNIYHSSINVVDWLMIAFSLAAIIYIEYQGRPKAGQPVILHPNSRFTVPKPSRWQSACGDLKDSAALSERQYEVFLYLARGHTAAKIASSLFISEYTVKSHIFRIYQKFGIHSQQELIDIVEERLRSC
jgi:DNA-binding CsgD family transcriptional regulator